LGAAFAAEGSTRAPAPTSTGPPAAAQTGQTGPAAKIFGPPPAVSTLVKPEVYARTRKDVTIYGKLMDPLADKFLVACSLIMLQELGRIPFAIVMLLICREIAITGLRALASARGASGSCGSERARRTHRELFHPNRIGAALHPVEESAELVVGRVKLEGNRQTGEGSPCLGGTGSQRGHF